MVDVYTFWSDFVNPYFVLGFLFPYLSRTEAAFIRDLLNKFCYRIVVSTFDHAEILSFCQTYDHAESLSALLLFN